MGSAADRSAEWLQSPRGYMPHGRDTRPRSQRRAESPVSARSGISAISERDMLHNVLMVDTDGQMSMRADEHTLMNMPTSSASGPCTYDECPTAGEPHCGREGPWMNERLCIFVKKRLGVGAGAPQGHVWYGAV
eukprot:2425604-Pyramimonas_sp.AAC.1